VEALRKYRQIRTSTQHHVNGATEWRNHRIAMFGGGMHCVFCGRSGKAIEDFGEDCEGVGQNETASNGASIKIVSGRLQEALKEKEEQRRKGLAAEAITRINSEVATAVLLQGIPSKAKDQEETQPK